MKKLIFLLAILIPILLSGQKTDRKTDNKVIMDTIVTQKVRALIEIKAPLFRSTTDSVAWLSQLRFKATSILYVAKNGNDINNGSLAFPFLTINAAITAANSGTTLIIMPGTYTENITFKSGVNLDAVTKFAVYITGNHTANFSGTVIVENIVLQSTSGITLTFSGSNSQNLQILGSSINANSGDAINWSNTNSASKLYFEDGTCNVATSGGSARCFYSTTGAAGGLIANRVTFNINNPDNICLSLGGAVSFTHTSDAVVGQMVVSGTASLTSSLCRHTTATVPVLVTNSSGLTLFFDDIDISTASPLITGAGAFAYSGIILPSTGSGSASTLNGGLGSICLQMAPIKIRPGTLKPVPQDGLQEYDGTHFYITIGSTRYQLDQQGGSTAFDGELIANLNVHNIDNARYFRVDTGSSISSQINGKGAYLGYSSQLSQTSHNYYTGVQNPNTSNSGIDITGGKVDIQNAGAIGGHTSYVIFDTTGAHYNYTDTSLFGDNHFVHKRWVLDRISTGMIVDKNYADSIPNKIDKFIIDSVLSGTANIAKDCYIDTFYLGSKGDYEEVESFYFPNTDDSVQLYVNDGLIYTKKTTDLGVALRDKFIRSSTNILSIESNYPQTSTILFRKWSFNFSAPIIIKYVIRGQSTNSIIGYNYHSRFYHKY
jgi:hypothetical protein